MSRLEIWNPRPGWYWRPRVSMAKDTLVFPPVELVIDRGTEIARGDAETAGVGEEIAHEAARFGDAVGSQPVGGDVEDEGPGALARGHQPLAFQVAIGLNDGGGIDPKLSRQLPDRRQRHPRFKLAGSD